MKRPSKKQLLITATVTILILIFAAIGIKYFKDQQRQSLRASFSQDSLCDLGKIKPFSVLLLSIADDEYDSFPECSIDSQDAMTMLHSLRSLRDDCEEKALLKGQMQIPECDPDSEAASKWTIEFRKNCARRFIALCDKSDNMLQYLLQDLGINF